MSSLTEQGASTLDWPTLLADACSGALPLAIHFQPIVDLRRGVVCGYESLSRFPAEVGQPPDRWFAEAARHGMGPALEQRALRTILAHRPSLADNCFLSLNLSPEAVGDPETQQILLGQADLRGVVLEITEQSEVTDYEALLAALRPVRDAGAAVAIDDAGAGYSSLRHIVALEPQFVKLDRSLVKGVDADPRKAAAIAAIGAFAGELDAWVVAEGIETDAELSALSSLALPLAQGFLLGRPAPEMGAVEPDVQQSIRRRTDSSEGGVGSLMTPAPAVRPGESPEDAFGDWPGAGAAVRVDEYDRPTALVLRRGDQLTEAPVMCTEAGTAPAELALRAMARESGLRFMPAACCDGRGRLLGLVPVERVVESLARG